MRRSRSATGPNSPTPPVIIGGETRGVVLACCYVARLYGVRSAMPMFRALAACPDAVVIRPNMDKYQEVGREVRAEMRRLTPLVEPLSVDEAFLDLSGKEALHGASPAQLLVGLANRVEASLGVTVSIGLSNNKFLAKIASTSTSPAVLQCWTAARLRSFSPINRFHCCGLSARQCKAASCPRRHHADWPAHRAGRP